MRKALLQLLLFAGYVVVILGWFLANDPNAVSFVVGVNLGVALVGLTQSALKLYRPDKYQFVYEAEGS
ncbi:hypothetical protein [Haloarchaeobius sp. FL176]|uniref:hypothetical protein n=1 Tax=Haloarchaeobius sp. FL176 TaxID=2967129 RepID=UPI002148408A|nr:hypothetical protein [Haloarchaeobius sp. FL176]